MEIVMLSHVTYNSENYLIMENYSSLHLLPKEV